MKKIGLFIVSLAILAGCSKDQPLAEVSFKVNISGFDISTDDFSSLKSGGSVFDDFNHVYAGGILYFKSEDGTEYMFSSGENSLDGTTITLVPGKYTIWGESAPPSPQGGPAMLYMVESQDVYITGSTTYIDLYVKPTCALALVADDHYQLKEAQLKMSGYDLYWDLFSMGIFYYTYFLPEEGYYLNLVKHDDTELTLPTKDLDYGYIYKIEVTESDGIEINLSSNFEEGESIVW